MGLSSVTSVITVGSMRREPSVLAARVDPAAFHQSQQALEVLVVDDAPVIRVLQRVLAVLLTDLGCQQWQEFISDVLVYDQVIGRHAGLADVEELAEGDARRGGFQVGAAVHDAGALAA